jgi:hypothetical protein
MTTQPGTFPPFNRIYRRLVIVSAKQIVNACFGRSSTTGPGYYHGTADRDFEPYVR